MDMQKTTSKTSLLNLMLLRAWRERWTDSQWGTNIKTILPRGVSGDVYNLAECILQQAVVGTDTNKLILSYLKHSLCSHLVSHAAVLKTISKYEGLDRPYCILSLLDFLDIYISGTTCRNKAEENQLANASLSLVFWLSQIYNYILNVYTTEGYIDDEQQNILKSLVKVIDKLMQNKFLLGIIYVGKHEDTELIGKIQQNYVDIKMLSANAGFAGAFQTHSFEDSLQIIAHLEIEGMQDQPADNTPESITYCLQPLISVEILLHPSNDTETFISKLKMVQRLKNYSPSRLYCELIRSCLSSLHNVSGLSNRESMWCAFTLIKVPLIIRDMENASRAKNDEELDYSPDVEAAFELLLEDPILDYLDTKYGCNTIESLLVELEKHNLVNEAQVKYFASRRETITSTLSKIDLNKNQPSIIKLIKRAEHPLPGILKALESEYGKMHEALLGMLSQVLSGSGNSFDLILSVVTVEGKLKTFVSRLIRYNESSKQVMGEPEPAAQTRAALFDVSFLMLTYIVQTFGPSVVLDEHGDTFFEKWVRECMMDRNMQKSPIQIVQQCDQAKVDELLNYLSNPDRCTLSTSLKWQDICMNIPGVLYHLLLAWENDTITPADVKTRLDGIKSQLCMYSVCAASWLSSYMQVVRDDELLKPMNMVQELLTPFQSNDESAQMDMKEGFGLTAQIIRRMQQDIHKNNKIRTLVSPHSIVSQNPLEEQFTTVWKTIDDRGWLPFESTQILESLFQTCGPFWLASKLVNEVLQCKYSRDMSKTVDIVFAIMHINIEACTVSLLSEYLPMLLLSKVQKCDLVEPLSSNLARLCVYCIVSSLEVCLNTTTKKRRHSNTCDTLDIAGPLAKIRKLNPDESSNSSLTDYPMQDDFTASLNTEYTTEPQMPVIREPLQTCLQNLFKTFAQFAIMDDLSPRIYFIFHFLTLLQQCGKDRVAPVLKLLPNGLIQNLLKVMVTNDATYEFILRTYDLNTTAGRNSAVSELCLLRTIHLRKNSITL